MDENASFPKIFMKNKNEMNKVLQEEKKHLCHILNLLVQRMLMLIYFSFYSLQICIVFINEQKHVLNIENGVY